VIELPAHLRWIGALWSFALGAAVGSFLNVVVARLPAGESVVHPRSRCPRCRSPIAWYDNLPLLSWLLLRGRCRSCREPISWRYPLVELLAALAAAAAFARHGLSAAALAEFSFAAALLALSAIDLATWLLPHVLTWPLLAAGLLLSAAGLGAAPSVGASVLGAAVGWGSFALVSVAGEKVFRKEAMGFGDVWLLGAIGAWLGVKALLPVVLLASVQGALVGVALILVGRSQPGPAEPPAGAKRAPAAGADDDDWVPPRHAVPFGPFLAAAALQWLWLQAWLARAVPALDLFR